MGMAKVAIVDDSKDALEVFGIILKGRHEFELFADPVEFLAAFRRGVYGLVLLDLAMPGMDGFEVFNRIRDVDDQVPVVAITAVASDQERERALQAGFCDYFNKPILEIEQFRQAVYSHVGQCANTSQDPSKKKPAA